MGDRCSCGTKSLKFNPIQNQPRGCTVKNKLKTTTKYQDKNHKLAHFCWINSKENLLSPNGFLSFICLTDRLTYEYWYGLFIGYLYNIERLKKNFSIYAKYSSIFFLNIHWGIAWPYQQVATEPLLPHSNCMASNAPAPLLTAAETKWHNSVMKQR